MTDRRAVLRGAGAAALGVTTTVLPTAAQAFSLTVNGSAVAGVTVYWSERGTVGGATGRIGRLVYNGDGSISNVDRNWLTNIESPIGLKTDGTSLYYYNPYSNADQGIWRVAIDKTRTRLVASVSASGIFVDATDLYYSAGSNINVIAKDGSGSATALATSAIASDGIFVTADTIYFSDSASNIAGNGRVGTLPKAGGAASYIATGLEGPDDIFVAGGVVYVGSTARRVHRFLPDGTSIGAFGTYGFVDGLQIVDTVAFVASSNSTGIEASGLDGVNGDLFAFAGDGATIVGVNMHGMAVLP